MTDRERDRREGQECGDFLRAVLGSSAQLGSSTVSPCKMSRGCCAVCVGSEVYCGSGSSVKCGLCHFFPGETQDCTGSTAEEAKSL